MAVSEKFEITGLKETLDVFRQLATEIGDKEARSKVLIPAVKEAMKPVLAVSKMLVAVDTGMLDQSLSIQGRRPTNSDKQSRYITTGDAVVAFVSTKPIPKKLNKEYKEKISKTGVSKKAFYESKGIFYDARAIANEFGTVNRPAKPFLRPALEAQASNVSTLLGMILDQKMRQYRSKNLK